MRLSVSGCVFAWLVPALALGQAPAEKIMPETRFDALTYISPQGGQLPYRLLKPKAVAAGQKYPLVVFLHGAGERGVDNTIQLIHGMADFASDAMMQRHPAYVIAPQCPADQQWVDTPWTAESHTMPAEPTPALRMVQELIGALEKEFPVDGRRIYITGLSMGGFGTWDLLQRQPERFAAAVPICGGGDPAFAPKIKNVPLWAFHGDADTTVKVKRSRDMVAALQAAGGRPVYTEYEGVGHNSWTATYANRAIWDWVFAQSR